MSSMVTSATVSTMTSAVTVDGNGEILALVMVVALVAGLMLRDVVGLSIGRGSRLFARGLSIGTAPLLAAFALLMVLKMVDFAQSR